MRIIGESASSELKDNERWRQKRASNEATAESRDKIHVSINLVNARRTPDHRTMLAHDDGMDNSEEIIAQESGYGSYGGDNYYAGISYVLFFVGYC